MRLEDYDFEEVGRWHIDYRIKSGINFHITKNERVIYAFEVNGEVKYIGICEKTTLGDRLKEYKYQTTTSEAHIANEIKKYLDLKKDVKIYALKPKSECKFKDLDVDLIKGLENPLINKFKPEWNRRI